MPLLERSATQIWQLPKPQIFNEAFGKLAAQLAPLCYTTELLDVHSQLTALAGAQNTALVDTLCQIVAQVSTLTLLRRHAIIAGLDDRLPPSIRLELRTGPFQHISMDMFSEVALLEARKDLD